MIKKSCIDSIKQAADIVDVVSSRVANGTFKKDRRIYEVCCPFHAENSPSFRADSRKGYAKCYGCNWFGDAIEFVVKFDGVSFDEACKTLAQQYGVEIDEFEQTPEQKALTKRKEAIIVAMRAAANFYHEQLAKDPAALAYCHSRGWSDEMIEEFNIGYAPDAWAELASWAVTNGWSQDVLAEGGMLHQNAKGGYYDTFRGRIMIPIITSGARVVGFTARWFRDIETERVEPGKKPAKYKNNEETVIFHKNETLFGSFTAFTAASSEGKIYVVEGGPDVMRLQDIGIINTVATLGTELTEAHAKQLKRFRKICFIPDGDMPKQGSRFSPGVASVLRSGALCLEHGMEVTVKELPMDTEKHEKRDADSFIKEKAQFRALQEIDFVTWAAGKYFADERTMTASEKTEATEKLASMIANVENATMRTYYIDDLAKVTKNKRFWENIIKEKMEEVKPVETTKEEKAAAFDALAEFGFVEREGCYTALNGTKPWGNFTLEPLFHIKDWDTPKRLYIIRNKYGDEDLIELKPSEMGTSGRLNDKLGGIGNYIWEAGDKELLKLRAYIFRNTRTASEVKQLGWQRKGFFAFGNGGVYDGRFIEADEYGIVDVPDTGSFYMPWASKLQREDEDAYAFERSFIHTTNTAISLRKYTDMAFKVFGWHAKIGFLFMLATLYRDIIVSVINLPILNMYGQPSTGKSEMGYWLMSFFTADELKDFLDGTTKSALAGVASRVANAIVFIDEYKNSSDPDKIQFLKNVWDGRGQTKRNMDKSMRVEQTAVKCGMVLCGQEMPNQDNALFTRLIFLEFKKTHFSIDEKRRFAELKEQRKFGATHLAIELMQYREKVRSRFRSEQKYAMEDIGKVVAQKNDNFSRITEGWSIILAIYRTLREEINVDIEYQELLELCAEGIKHQQEQCSKSSEISQFWETVQYLKDSQQIYEEGDYQIRVTNTIKTDKLNVTYQEPMRLLYIRGEYIITMVRKELHRSGEKPIDKQSMVNYIINDPAFYGRKAGVRLYKMIQGIKQPDTRNPNAKATQCMRCFCFNYDELVEKYGIQLDDGSTGDLIELP